MHVKIYKPSASPMQSGRLKSRWWIIEFEQTAFVHKEPLMHWNSISSTQHHLSLRFSNLEKAIQYAENQGFSYTVIPPPKTLNQRIRPYSSNFLVKR